MSERGQKIFKWIVWIVLVVIIAFSVWGVYQNINNPTISEERVSEIVVEKVGGEPALVRKPSNKKATGQYTTLAIMDALGDSSIEFLSGKESLSDDEKIALAIENGIVEKGELDKEVSEDSAQEIIDKTLGYYFTMDNYPEKCDITYVSDVFDVSNAEYSSFSEEDEVLIIASKDVPEIGQVILPRDEFGIAKPRRVDGVEQLEDGSYQLVVSKLENPEELYSEIDFSGKADFSYLLAAGDNSPTEEANSDIDRKSIWGPVKVYAAETKEYTTKADIETGGKIAAKDKNGSGEFSYNSYLKITDEDKNETKFSVTKNSKGKLKLEAVRNDLTLEGEHAAKTAEDYAKEAAEGKKDEFKKELSVTDSFSYKVKLKDLQIAASYRNKGNKDDRFVDVRVTSDVELYWIVEGKFEGKIPITEIEVPIKSTLGLASVNLRLYLVVDASGQVSLVYEMDDVYAGMRVDKHGFTTPHGRNKANDRLDITAKVEASIGLCAETAITVGDWLDLAEKDLVDPGIEVKMHASAETLKNNEGFENYPQCVQTKLYGPTVSFDISAGEDSTLYWFLDLFNLTAKASYDFISEDNAPWKKEYHIETELDGATNFIEGDKDYCTHIKLEEEDTLDPAEIAKKRAEEAKKKAEEAARKKAEEARKKAQEEFEKALEDAIERWLEENCGGC